MSLVQIPAFRKVKEVPRRLYSPSLRSCTQEIRTTATDARSVSRTYIAQITFRLWRSAFCASKRLLVPTPKLPDSCWMDTLLYLRKAH